MKGYTVKQSFNDIALKSFDSSTQNLDYSKSPDAAAVINSWVEDKTNKKIQKLFTSDAFNNQTRLVLVNAIYFKGLWKDKFDPKNTFKNPFYLDETNTVSVDFMMLKKKFFYSYLPALKASAISLPYKDSDISMLFILPSSYTGLPLLEESLQSMNLLDMMKNLTLKEVTVFLPKFKIETELDMKSILKAVSAIVFRSDVKI